jgi:hypothetical protein
VAGNQRERIGAAEHTYRWVTVGSLISQTSKKIYKYKDMKVTFRGGKVVDVE